MSDIRLVNVIPVVNGWKTASLKNKGEAKKLMTSGNLPDYNAGLVKDAAADLVVGMAEDHNDPTPHSAWKNICKEEQAEAARMKAIGTLVSVIKQMADLAGYEVVGRIVFMDKDSGRIYR